MRDGAHVFFFTGQSQGPASHFLRGCDPFPLCQQKNCVDCIWIVDVIRRDSRRVRSAARLGSEHFVKEAALLDVAGEHFSLVDVLIADR